MTYFMIEAVLGSNTLITYTATNKTGTTWYNIKGSRVINMTEDEVYDGVKLDVIRDDARYNHDSTIECLDDFVKALKILHGTND